MARRPRVFLEGVPAHIHQRGNNRADMFRDTYDRIFLLMALREATKRFHVAIHAWVFMSNHLHLLVTPSDVDGIPRLMQQVGSRYVPFFNKRHQRTGGLWEGRYNAHPVDTDNYWFQCHRYIELNPVRASIVSAPHEYPWSSYHANAYGADDPLVTPHPIYLASGRDENERQLAHRLRCGTPLTDVELGAIRHALRCGRSGANLPEAVNLVAVG